MDLSIIIVNYKTPKLCENCIKSICNTLDGVAIDYEVVLVDNNSGDNSFSILKKLNGENIRVIETEKNGGFGYGNNRGAEIAKGDLYFFLNSDTILYESVLLRMIDQMKSDSSIGVMGCLMVDGQDRALVTAHSFENTRSLFIQTIIKPFIPKFIKKTRGSIFLDSHTGMTECDWVSGAAMLMRRTVFEEVGGWNEKYFLYMEDEELCYRIRSKGYKVILYPEVGLQHLVSMSGGSAFSAYQRYKSKMIYYHDTDLNHYRINRMLLLLQARQYMKNLPNGEKKDVISKLKEIHYE